MRLCLTRRICAILLLRPLHWPVLVLGPIAGLVYMLAVFVTGALGRAEINLVVAIVTPRIQRVALRISASRRGL